MDSIISRGRRALDSFIGRDPPPDDTLETCKKHLTMLVKSIDHVEQKFEKYASSMVQCADAGRLVGNDVVNFYKRASDRHKQAQICNQIESHLQSLSMSIWKEDFNEYESVAANFSEWKYEVNELRDKLKQAEQLRKKAFHRKENIGALEGKGGKVSMSNVFSTETDNIGKIKQEKEMYSQEIQDYKIQRSQIQKSTQKFLNERFEKFDKIFMRFMELQIIFFSRANTICKKFKPTLEAHRRKFPPSRSAGDLGDPEEETETESEYSSDEDDEDVEEEGTMTMKNPPKQEIKKSSVKESPAPSEEKVEKKKRAKSAPEQDNFLGFDFSQKQTQKKKSATPVNQTPNAVKTTENNDPFGLFSAPISKNDPTKNAFAAPTTSNSNRPSSSISDFEDFSSDFTFPSAPTTEKVSSSPSKQKKSSLLLDNDDEAFSFFTGPSMNSRTTSQPQQPTAKRSPMSSSDPFAMFSSSTLIHPKPAAKPPSSNNSTKSNSSSEKKKKKKKTKKRKESVTFDPLSSNFGPTPKEKEEAEGGLQRKGEDGRFFHEEMPDDPALVAEIKKAQKIALDEIHRLQDLEGIEHGKRAIAQEQVKNIVDKWEFDSGGDRKNLRALLSTVHIVLDYSEGKWEKLELTDLVSHRDVKKAYRQSMRIVHPDATGLLNYQQQAKAERVFRALTETWDEFKKQK